MTRVTKLSCSWIPGLIAGGLFGLVGLSWAQQPDMPTSAVTTGGGISSVGQITLVSSTGQASVGRMESTAYALEMGVLAEEHDPQLVFTDGFESGSAADWSSVVGGGSQ